MSSQLHSWSITGGRDGTWRGESWQSMPFNWKSSAKCYNPKSNNKHFMWSSAGFSGICLEYCQLVYHRAYFKCFMPTSEPKSFQEERKLLTEVYGQQNMSRMHVNISNQPCTNMLHHMHKKAPALRIFHFLRKAFNMRRCSARTLGVFCNGN